MNGRENGSVLIEALIGAALVALVLASMYGIVGDDAMRDRIVTQKRMALLIAQSEMDAVGATLPVATGSTGGVEGPYVWRVDIQPYAASQGVSNSGPLLQVTVSVRPRDGTVTLVTLKSLALGAVS